MTVCRYFLQGNCRFGDRCRFEHTDPYESNAYDNSNRNNYSYQDRGRQQQVHPNYNQDRSRQYNQRYDSSERQNSHNRYNSSERYDQNQRYYSSERNQRDPYEASVGHSSNKSHKDSEPDYFENRYNRNKHAWMSEGYKKQLEEKTQRPGNERFFSSSTPKSKTSFSFKDTEEHSRKDKPFDLCMNEKNVLYAEIVKEDTLSWELGNQWPFTCYCPIPEKSTFPGFTDLSPEELRYEAYKAKGNNTYNFYVESVEKALLDIKNKRDQLKEPSMQLMSMIERIRRGEDLSSECVDGTATSLMTFNQTAPEDMVADESSVPQSTSASSFSFKTTLETDMLVKNSASSFSFKVPPESGPKTSGQDANSDIYTHLDKISQQDKEQFSASTFTLGKIPTVPPPQQMCF